MSLSDCEKCWETPCVCGHGYKNYTTKRKVELIRAVLKGVSHKELQDIVNDIFVIMPDFDSEKIEVLIKGK